MPSALILGAGVVGISSALHLRDAGWDVALVDLVGFGTETSFGNAGIIQADTVEPYAMPRSLLALLSMALGRTNDVRYRLRDLAVHLPDLARYWWASSPRRYRAITQAYAPLVLSATAEHERWIAASRADGLVRRDGYRMVFRTASAMHAAAALAERLGRDHDIPFRAMDAAQLAAAEPSLRDCGAGALQWPSAWTVRDPGALMAAYGRLLLHMGGSFHRADAATLVRAGAGWCVTEEGVRVSAEHVVIALGPWSPAFLRRFGACVPMIHKRGYHMTYAAPAPLNLPIFDAGHGYVIAPMTNGLRITTGAHLATFDASDDHRQLDRAEAAARSLLDLGHRVDAVPWSGTRPFLPDMLPLIGRSDRADNFWVNFGHGHQGLTLGPSSGRLLAELMTGKPGFVDPIPFSPARHGL